MPVFLPSAPDADCAICVRLQAMPLFSDYGDHPDSSARLSYPSLVFAIVTPLVVIARLLGRRFLSGRVGADDWTILVSCVRISNGGWLSTYIDSS